MFTCDCCSHSLSTLYTQCLYIYLYIYIYCTVNTSALRVQYIRLVFASKMYGTQKRLERRLTACLYVTSVSLERFWLEFAKLISVATVEILAEAPAAAAAVAAFSLQMVVCHISMSHGIGWSASAICSTSTSSAGRTRSPTIAARRVRRCSDRCRRNIHHW